MPSKPLGSCGRHVLCLDTGAQQMPWLSGRIFIFACRFEVFGIMEALSFQEHEGIISGLSLSADGCYALTSGSGKTVKLRETATGKCLQEFLGHGHEVWWSMCLSDDCTLALAAGDSRNRDNKHAGRLWETATGRCVCTFESNGVFSVCLSRSERRVLMAGILQPMSIYDTRQASSSSSSNSRDRNARSSHRMKTISFQAPKIPSNYGMHSPWKMFAHSRGTLMKSIPYPQTLQDGSFSPAVGTRRSSSGILQPVPAFRPWKGYPPTALFPASA